jgi:hypothetical protein
MPSDAGAAAVACPALQNPNHLDPTPLQPPVHHVVGVRDVRPGRERGTDGEARDTSRAELTRPAGTYVCNSLGRCDPRARRLGERERELSGWLHIARPRHEWMHRSVGYTPAGCRFACCTVPRAHACVLSLSLSRDNPHASRLVASTTLSSPRVREY